MGGSADDGDLTEGNVELMSPLSSHNEKVQVGQSLAEAVCARVHMSVTAQLAGRLKNLTGASEEQLSLSIRTSVMDDLT